MINTNLGLAVAGPIRPPAPTVAVFDKQAHFGLGARDYGRQFALLYQHRLAELKPRTDSAAAAKWNAARVDDRQVVHKQKILDIASGELCWVLGTVFADLRKKLNILHDVERGTDDVMPSVPTSYVDPDDGLLMLEDDSGRAVLHNDALLRHLRLVTGCFVAVLGVEIQAGVFEVMEIVCPTPAPQRPLRLQPSLAPQSLAPTALGQPLAHGTYIALVSGLQFGTAPLLDLRAFLLRQWLAGALGAEAAATAGRVTRVVFAGDSIAESAPIASDNFGSKNTSRFLSDGLRLFDNWLADVAATVPITLMPGTSDPAETCLPQQPVHRSLLGPAGRAAGDAAAPVHCATNPAWMELESGARLLGSAGQNVADILKYMPDSPTVDETLEVMTRMLQWQHMAPTAPDTLYCYPFVDRDPFVLDETPHVLFAGNQCGAGWRDVDVGGQTVKVVAVPRFCETGQIVLLNVETLEAATVDFAV